MNLVPVYWKWKLGGITGAGGSWEEASSIHHDTGTVSGGGSWTVNKNWTTLSRSSPGNRSSSSGSGCSNASGQDYCDDTGTCSTKSEKGVAGPCGHNWCCCADYDNSGSSNTGSSNTGSSSGGSSSGGSTPPSSNTATCSTCNAPYNSNNSSLVNRHRVRTCMRPACGQSWQLCSGGKPETCGASSSWRCRE